MCKWQKHLWDLPAHLAHLDPSLATYPPCPPPTAVPIRYSARVEEDPDHVDVVPVDGGRLDAPVAFGGEVPSAAFGPDHQDQDDAADHVQRMQARHAVEHGAVHAVSRFDVVAQDELRLSTVKPHSTNTTPRKKIDPKMAVSSRPRLKFLRSSVAIAISPDT